MLQPPFAAPTSLPPGLENLTTPRTTRRGAWWGGGDVILLPLEVVPGPLVMSADSG